jgi:hypothetical protein
LTDVCLEFGIASELLLYLKWDEKQNYIKKVKKMRGEESLG